MLNYPDVHIVDGSTVVDFESWFEKLNPKHKVYVEAEFDDGVIIDIYNRLYIEWLGELINKYRDKYFCLNEILEGINENSKRSC